MNRQLTAEFLPNLGANDIGGSTLYNYLTSNTDAVVNSELFPEYINAMTTSWSTDAQLDAVCSFFASKKL